MGPTGVADKSVVLQELREYLANASKFAARAKGSPERSRRSGAYAHQESTPRSRKTMISGTARPR